MVRSGSWCFFKSVLACRYCKRSIAITGCRSLAGYRRLPVTVLPYRLPKRLPIAGCLPVTGGILCAPWGPCGAYRLTGGPMGLPGYRELPCLPVTVRVTKSMPEHSFKNNETPAVFCL